jgi:hypothetical protein
MNDKIKTAIEIAMERAAMLEDLSEEEKESIENKKKLNPIMTGFYRNEIGPEKLWTKLKNERASLLKQAQLNLLESLKFSLEPEEIKRRNKGIIAIESLKKDQKTSAIQQGLSLLENMQKKAETEKKQVFNEFKKAVENNPQARTRVVEQGGAKIVLKLSVEDAIAQNQQWKQFLSDFEKNYNSEFDKVCDQVKKYIS